MPRRMTVARCTRCEGRGVEAGTVHFKGCICRCAPWLPPSPELLDRIDRRGSRQVLVLHQRRGRRATRRERQRLREADRRESGRPSGRHEKPQGRGGHRPSRTKTLTNISVRRSRIADKGVDGLHPPPRARDGAAQGYSRSSDFDGRQPPDSTAPLRPEAPSDE